MPQWHFHNQSAGFRGGGPWGRSSGDASPGVESGELLLAARLAGSTATAARPELLFRKGTRGALRAVLLDSPGMFAELLLTLGFAELWFAL